MTPAIVLAAGAASRFGEPKQRLLLPAVLDSLSRAAVGPIVVVEGAHPLAGLMPGGVALVHCDDWALGPGASLRRGLDALPREAERVIVVLADGPCLDPRAVERILAHRARSGLVAASYGGVRGHPLLLVRALWAAIPDEGMRSVPAELVPCDDLTAPGDVDYAADVRSPTSFACNSSGIGSDAATRT